MSNILKISEAASLALHSTVLLASNVGKLMPTKEIASELHVSEAHLSKVLQRLSRMGIVKAVRGPKGGFTLGKPASEISLIHVYESIEGPLVIEKCLFDIPVCGMEKCILGGFLAVIERQFRDYLVKTKLSELSIYMKDQENGKNQKDNKN